MRTLIVGAGGHGREVAEILAEAFAAGGEFQPFGFIDDNPKMKGVEVAGLPVLGGLDWALGETEEFAFLPAIGTPRICRLVTEKILAAGRRLGRAVSPSAQVSPRARLADGVTLFPNTWVSCEASIGRCSILNVASTVSHDSVVGDFCNINPGARLAGSVTVGQGSYVGMGALIIQGKTLGPGVVIGAGAVVIRDVPEGATAVGVPARVIKSES